MTAEVRAAAKEVVEKNDARTLHDLAGVIKAFEGGMLSASTALAAIRHLLPTETYVRGQFLGDRLLQESDRQFANRLTRPPIMATGEPVQISSLLETGK